MLLPGWRLLPYLSQQLLQLQLRILLPSILGGGCSTDAPLSWWL
jgi:hypothetical protein